MSGHQESSDYWWTSGDGLRLYSRVYEAAGAAAPTVVCLPGLTRNSRDFASLAAHLSGRYRLLCPDLRGRGRSQWDPKPANYQPATYYQDVLQLLRMKVAGRAAIIGTSLGGILAMLLASTVPDHIAGIILNDVGPEVAPEGLARIARYVGLTAAPGTWAEATRQVQVNYGLALPDLTEAGWLAYARASYRELDDGRVVADYDPAIGDVVRSGASTAAPDLWPLWKTLAAMPALALRGATSDILSAATLDRMRREKPDLETVVVPNRGHVPLLDEPVALPAIDRFLARLFTQPT